MNYEDYTIHPLADAFPLIEGEEFDELCQSIDEHGLLEPIVMQDGVLIDGRNRLRACLQMGVAPDFTEYAESMEIPEYIWSKNAQRRHLKDDQRAMAATAFLDYEEAEAAKRRLAALDAQKANEARWHGDEVFQALDEKWSSPDQRALDAVDLIDEESYPVQQKPAERDSPAPQTRDKIAERANVSRYKAEQAIAVKRYDDEHGTDLGKQVAKGEVKLKDAVKVAKPIVSNTLSVWRNDAEVRRAISYIEMRVRACPEDKREGFKHELAGCLRGLIAELEEGNA